MATSTHKIHDVLIIGGGPAGLSAAAGLARQVINTVIFDSGVYRNARATHMHNVLGFDHAPPSTYRSKARADLLARYPTISFQDTAITTVQKLSHSAPLFRATDTAGTQWHARRLVLATGVQDIMPDIEGYEDCWARGIFHCLFCHGFEERGAASAGVLATKGHTTNPMVARHLALMAKNLAKQVTVYTNGADALEKELRLMAEQLSFALDNREIKSFARGAAESEVAITFTSGETVTEGFLAHTPFSKQSAPFAEQLGVELSEMGDINVSVPFNETNIPGVFAAGDCANPMKAVPLANAQAGLCAAGVVASLGLEGPIDENEIQSVLQGLSDAL